jgi:hypothetical protein
MDNIDILYDALKDIVRVQKQLLLIGGYLQGNGLTEISGDLIRAEKMLDNSCQTIQKVYEKNNSPK